jgi:hypothetical protein
MQQYVLMFVSNLRQVCGYLHKTDRHDTTRLVDQDCQFQFIMSHIHVLLLLQDNY